MRALGLSNYAISCGCTLHTHYSYHGVLLTSDFPNVVSVVDGDVGSLMNLHHHHHPQLYLYHIRVYAWLHVNAYICMASYSYIYIYM